MSRCVLWLLVVGALLSSASPAAADDIDVELVSKVLKGQGKPAVVLTANRTVASVALDLKSDAGARLSVKHGSIRRGSKHALEIDAPDGQTRFEGSLAVEFADGGRGEMPLSFTVEVVIGLEVEAPAGRLDIEARRLQLRMSRPAGRCDYQVFSQETRPKRGSAMFGGEPAWTWLTVAWPQTRGRVQRIRLTCYDKDGFSRKLELMPLVPLTLTVPKDRVDPTAGKLELQMSRAAAACSYDLAYDGAEPLSGEVKFSGEPAGTWLTVAWQRRTAKDVLLRIELTCVDTTGSSAIVEILPWQLDVPHEEVTFETGKWAILQAERAKLDRALAAITTAIRRYGKIIDVKLYVIGYTDTVGSRSSNRTLSLNRARSIAGYFKGQGVEVPIAYTGYGEDVLAVATPDETDETRNRRARYILAVEEPEEARWTKLRQ